MRTGMAVHDYREWMPEFERWLALECKWIEHNHFSFELLCESFGRWCMANQSVPCTHVVFHSLLREQGFSISCGLIHGLVLRAWADDHLKGHPTGRPFDSLILDAIRQGYRQSPRKPTPYRMPRLTRIFPN
jgi:hypothetical protein